MSDQAPPPPPPPPPPPAPPLGPPQYAAPVGVGQPFVGRIRPTGLWVLLFLVSCGIAGLVWWYLVHDEMKRHSGQGIGGVVALVVAWVASPVSAFLTSDEVGKLYERAGRQPPVTAITGLWYFPGIFILVGPFIWFAQTNGALNEYWRSWGAV